MVEYCRRTGSIPELQMPWVFASPGHQQIWWWWYFIHTDVWVTRKAWAYLAGPLLQLSCTYSNLGILTCIHIHIQTSENPPVLGPWPVKTVEDQWNPLLCRSSCPIKKSCRKPLYGDSNVEKKWGPVKVLEDKKNLDFPCGHRSSSPVKVQKFSLCLHIHNMNCYTVTKTFFLRW